MTDQERWTEAQYEAIVKGFLAAHGPASMEEIVAAVELFQREYDRAALIVAIYDGVLAGDYGFVIKDGEPAFITHRAAVRMKVGAAEIEASGRPEAVADAVQSFSEIVAPKPPAPPRAPNELKPEIQDRLIEAVKSGEKSKAEIAAEFGVAKGTVRRYRKLLGVTSKASPGGAPSQRRNTGDPPLDTRPRRQRAEPKVEPEMIVFLCHYARGVGEDYFLEPVASFGGNAFRVWRRIGSGPLEVAEWPRGA